MKEIWKEIPHFEGLYEASTYGQIRSVEGKATTRSDGVKRVWKQRILKQKICKCKRKSDARVNLWKDNVPYTFLVSRLIASTFIKDNLFTELTVNHKDGNPLNNNVDNLEWLTLQENIQYGFANGQYSSTQKPIDLFKDGCTIHFKSYNDANRFLNRNSGYMSQLIQRGNNTATSEDGEIYQIIHNDISS